MEPIQNDTKMHSLLPLDSRLIRDIMRPNRENMNRGFTNQPVVGDPYDLTASNYSWQANNVLQTTAIEINRWQKGDRALIRQSSTDKTFFVTAVDKVNYRVSLSAGSTFTFTNNAIQRIQIAPIRIIPPSYPATYQFNPNLSVGTGAISNISYTRRDFSVLGDTCSLYLTASFDISGGGASDIIVDLPVRGFNLGSTSSTNLGSLVGVGSMFTPMFAYASSLSGSDYIQCTVTIGEDYFDGLSNSISGRIDYKIL